MPLQDRAEADAVVPTVPVAEPAPPAKDHWRTGLPPLAGTVVTLRELRPEDAQALLVMLATDEVTRFISPPPATIEGFEKFIAWSARQRAAGLYVCFAIVPRGSDTPVGLFQIRSLEPEFGTAEWGFALAPEFWGTGMFTDGARLAIAFAFETLGTHRLEARASLANGRGSAALAKLGATREGILPKSFLRHGEHHDQALWTILADERPGARRTGAPHRIH